MHPVIDAHIHIQPFHMMKPDVQRTFWHKKEIRAEIESYAADPVKLLRRMDEDGVERVGLINYVSPDLMGFTDEANDWMVEYASADPARLIAFGSVNPRFTDDVKGAVARVIERGARAIKVHPPHQIFRANAYQDSLPQLAHVYEGAQAAGIPVTIHTGTSVFPGARSRFGDPMDVDDVAIDFPKLTILLAHGGRPLWMGRRLLRRPASSQRPPRAVGHSTREAPRILSASRRDLLTSRCGEPTGRAQASCRCVSNVEQFTALPLAEAAKRKILYDNAARIFGQAP